LFKRSFKIAMTSAVLFAIAENAIGDFLGKEMMKGPTHKGGSPSRATIIPPK
jgi:cytochrome bd-type quinol oxidase subunit 1